MTAQKWLDSTEKQKKKRFEDCDRQWDRGTDIQTESIDDNNRLLS